VKTRTLRRSLSYDHTRRGVRLVIVLLLVFGVGNSLWEGDVAAAPVGPSASAAEWSALYYSYGQQLREESPTAAATSCDDLSVLVDRSHTLPPDYAPGDLVPLQDYGVPTLGSEVLRREAAEHLGRLVEDAAVDGEELVIASGYRSYEEQKLSHVRLMSVFGAGAAMMSATPGHSQHQLGTAVDFTNAAAAYEVWGLFAQTSAHWWLEQHAWEYGFVLAYPEGKEDQTGYEWEPWHYRFVGVEDAKRLQESDLSLQVFLEREGTMPRC
jgi:D-alanyl-D-alanine carboxypeptidase